MKTKNLFLGMLAMAGMLFATSCSQDELLNETSTGDFVNATFKIGTSDGLGTRAAEPVIGKGTTVNYVACAVYDENGDEMDLRQYVPITNKEAKFETRLAKGQKYRVAFFAYYGDESGNCDYYNLSDMTNITVTGNQLSNIEARDAFTKYIDIDATKTMNKIEETVELKRPFAQLNLGIDKDEYEAAKKAGVVVTKSYIKVNNVYTAFNTYEDMVVDGNADVPMEFSLNTIPTEELLIDADDDGTFEDNEKYTYLALNYLLAGNNGTEKQLTDVEFVWETADGKQNSSPITFINIPIQRNYRTNIYGKLLTSPAEFTIKIDEKFENSPADDKNIKFDEVDGVLHATATDVTSLQEAINQAKSQADEKNPVTVKISYTGNGATTYGVRSASTTTITISQIAGLNYIIDGCGNTFDGTFYIHGDARSKGKETLRLVNFKFEHSENSALDFISANSTASTERYAHNVSVENCSFVGNESSDVVGMRYRQCYNMTVKNCTFDKMHSLMWATGGDGITLDNVTVTNSKNGASFGTTNNLVVKASNITAGGDYGYAIRVDASGEYVLDVENCNLEADAPILLRKATGNYEFTLEGNNTLTTTKAYHIITTAADYEEGTELTAPTGTLTITGAEGYNVYPMTSTSEMNANSTAQLSSVIAAGATIVNLTEGNYTLPSVNSKDITITGTEDVVITVDTPNYRGADLTLSGVTVKGSGYATGVQHVNTVTYKDVKIVGDMCLYGEEVKFENCTFELNNQYIWTYGAKKVLFDECRFNTTGKAILIYNEGANANSDVTVTDCTFNATAGAKAGAIANQNCAAIEIDSTYGDSFTLTTSGNSINKDYFSGTWRIKACKTEVTVNNEKYSTIAIDGKTMTIDGDKNVIVNN